MSVRQVFIVSLAFLLRDAAQENSSQIVNLSPPQHRKVGDNVILDCTVVNPMHNSVVWTKDNSLIVENNVIKTGDRRLGVSRIEIQPGDVYRLILNEVQESDSGIYKCEVTDGKEVSASEETRIIVKPAQDLSKFQSESQSRHHRYQREVNSDNKNEPSISFITKGTIKNEDDEVSLKCKTRRAEGYDVLWEKDDVPISHMHGSRDLFAKESRYLAEKSGKEIHELRIPNLRISDSGRYTCKIVQRTDPSISKGSRSVMLTVNPRVQKEQSQPLRLSNPASRIMSISPELTRSTGESATLTCKVENAEDSQVIWTKDGKNIAENEERLLQDARYSININNSGSYNLLIESLEPEDYGTYSCELQPTEYAKSQGVSAMKRNVKLNVVYKPIVKPHDLIKIPASIGDTVEIKCDILANPPAKIIWMKDDVDITLSEKYESSQTASSKENMVELKLRIFKIDSNDYGIYTCRGTSTLGTDEADIEVADSFLENSTPTALSVKVEEQSSRSPEYSTRTIKVVECTVRGSPRLSVEWYKNGVNIEHLSGYEIDKETVSETHVRSVLTIRNLDDEYYGMYECVGWNSEGTEQATYNVLPDPVMPLYPHDYLKCSLHETFLEELMLKIDDLITKKVVNKLDQAMNLLQNRDYSSENKIKRYRKDSVEDMETENKS